MQISKKAAVLFGILGLTAGTVGTIAFQTHAAGPAATTGTNLGIRHGIIPAAAGSVTAISGNTITVSDKRTGTSFTVDAGGATIQKITPPQNGTRPTSEPTPETITVSQIQVGDNVAVEGTVSGTNITATKVLDGVMMGMGNFRGRDPRGAAGTVSAVSGNTITMAGKNGTTYTVNAGSATVKKVSDSSVSNIAVGDTLMVNGTTSGSTITANNIVDGVPGKQ
ncbi:MAG: DUF5666 domain-containing protein [Candidatus Doudnabacteria bacterium]|nr:DUF5666 domain-containing protein [Candidatus Doudnabacteria bacterium]